MPYSQSELNQNELHQHLIDVYGIKSIFGNVVIDPSGPQGDNETRFFLYIYHAGSRSLLTERHAIGFILQAVLKRMVTSSRSRW